VDWLKNLVDLPLLDFAMDYRLDALLFYRKNLLFKNGRSLLADELDRFFVSLEETSSGGRGGRSKVGIGSGSVVVFKEGYRRVFHHGRRNVLEFVLLLHKKVRLNEGASIS